jgi:acetate kinase
MNILVLMPRMRRLDYAFFGQCERKALLESHISGISPNEDALVDTLGKIKADCMMFNAGSPGLVVIRAAYGGTAFTRPARVDAEMLSRFAALALEAPMHVPPAHALAEASLQAFKDAIVVMAFETSFFVDLPDRERRYGISDGSVRRFGYHGLYHQAASMQRDGLSDNGPTRTLSICLEPQPELAAIIGRRPIVVTSGATPLEGLPGETTCGELDPTIVLTMARNLNWGPEQINNVLTRHSGLRGLLGRPAHLGTILDSPTWAAEAGLLPPESDGTPGAARNMLAYRILLAAGAAAAAMGGLDRIVLTGRYAQQGHGIGHWLSERLGLAGGDGTCPPVVRCEMSLPRILADQGAVTMYEEYDYSAVALARSS